MYATYHERTEKNVQVEVQGKNQVEDLTIDSQAGLRESDVVQSCPRNFHHNEAHRVNIARNNGLKIEMAFSVRSNHLARVPSCRAGRIRLCARRPAIVELPRLRLEVEPVPFSLIALLTNGPKFSQSESFALMAPTPPL